MKWHSKGAFEQSVDIGHRFGKDNRFGVRVNAYSTNGERSIKNWDLEQRNVYVNLDQKNDRSNTNFLFGYTYTDSQGRPYGVSVGSSYVGNSLPSAPDGDINFNPVWRRDKNTNLVMTLNHEQKINDHLTAFLNAGGEGFGSYPFPEAGFPEAGAASDKYILEPGREQILAAMIPQLRRLKLYAAILDSVASEHAARMIAMQAATDNAEDLLAELSLEYNKGRQAKITSEILDLVAGSRN